MKVLILAGGFATRLWPLTEHRAKPLLLLDGKTILAHILEKLPQDAEIFLLTNQAFAADFQQELKNLKRKKVSIFCEDAHSDREKLGALGAISVAIREFKIQDDVLIFAGDNLLPLLRVDALLSGSDQACIAVRNVSNLDEARKFGVVEVNDELRITNYELEGKKRVENFEEKPEHPKSTLVSTGFLFLGHALFPILHEFARHSPDALGAIFPEFLRHGKTVLATEVGGEWFDVGSFDTYLESHMALQHLPLLLGSGVRQSGNQFSGKVFLGAGAKVKNCRITDSIIYPNCHLENCQISQSVIDESCHLVGLDLNRKIIRRRTKTVAMNNDQ